MCGIVGILGARNPRHENAISAMVQSIHHRGPDDCGYHGIRLETTDVWLGNTRLSIVDLSQAGHQPMCDEQTGNWIVYTGEIYNFREVRHQIVQLGLNFHSDCDTEVLLKAYGVWGPKCIEHLSYSCFCS